MLVYTNNVRVLLHILHPAAQASSTKDNRGAIAIDDLLSLNLQNTIGHFDTLLKTSKLVFKDLCSVQSRGTAVLRWYSGGYMRRMIVKYAEATILIYLFYIVMKSKRGFSRILSEVQKNLIVVKSCMESFAECRILGIIIA